MKKTWIWITIGIILALMVGMFIGGIIGLNLFQQGNGDGGEMDEDDFIPAKYRFETMDTTCNQNIEISFDYNNNRIVESFNNCVVERNLGGLILCTCTGQN